MAVADPTYAAEHDIDVTGATVADLYDKGLMRTGSADDLKYWGADDQGSIADVAANFLKTSESQTHQAFDKYFGRMAGSEGLDYFAGITSTGDVASEEEELATAQGLTLSDYIGGIIGYTGGTINEATGKDWDVSAETLQTFDSSNIKGNINSSNVSVGGVLKGNIKSDKIKIKSTADVDGVLNQKNLSIEDGAKLKIKAETY